MRRPTLEEKRYGPGFRPGPSPSVKVKRYHRCAIDECDSQVYGTAELFIDDQPPAMDWYTRFLSKLPTLTWLTIPFCQGHLEGVIRRSVSYLEEPDLWAPWRENPPVLPRPPKLVNP